MVGDEKEGRPNLAFDFHVWSQRKKGRQIIIIMGYEIFWKKKYIYIYLCIKTPRPSSIFVFVFHFNCFTHESLKKAQHFFFLKKKKG